MNLTYIDGHVVCCMCLELVFFDDENNANELDFFLGETGTDVIVDSLPLMKKVPLYYSCACVLVKAKMDAISSDTHQLQLIKLHHFKLERFKSI